MSRSRTWCCTRDKKHKSCFIMNHLSGFILLHAAAFYERSQNLWLEWNCMRTLLPWIAESKRATYRYDGLESINQTVVAISISYIVQAYQRNLNLHLGSHVKKRIWFIKSRTKPEHKAHCWSVKFDMFWFEHFRTLKLGWNFRLEPGYK